jgi:hypothetical protein
VAGLVFIAVCLYLARLFYKRCWKGGSKRKEEKENAVKLETAKHGARIRQDAEQTEQLKHNQRFFNFISGGNDGIGK